MKQIVIMVRRAGATKWLYLVTDSSNYLSICQIFESTDDVAEYTVQEMDMLNLDFKKDMFILDALNSWKKWKEVPRS